MTATVRDSSDRNRIGIYETSQVLHEDTVAKTFLARRGMGDGEGRPWVELTVVNAAIARNASIRSEFIEAARVLSEVQHRHFQRPLYSFQLGGSLHSVTEHREGKRLSCLVRERAAIGVVLPPEVIVKVFLDVTEGLTALHQHDPPIVHGDVTNSNILLGDDGSSFLVFSGLGRAFPLGLRNDRIGYKAPEQLALEQRSVTPAADVFSCAVALCEALSGHNALLGETESETVDRVLQVDGSSMLDHVPGHLPQRLAELVERALSRDPAARFADAAQLRAALLECRVASASQLEVRAVVRQPATQESRVGSDESTRVASIDSGFVLPPPRVPPPPRPKRNEPPAVGQVLPAEPPKPEARGGPVEDDAATLLYVREHGTADERTEPDAIPGGGGRDIALWASVSGAVVALVVLGVVIQAGRAKAPVGGAEVSSQGEHVHAPPVGVPAASAIAAAAPGPDRAAAAPESCKADLSKDPRNCGACANDCGGGKCNEGICSPTVVASNRARPSGIATDGADVYWTNSAAKGSVMKVPLSGGKPMTLAGSQPSPDGIAVDGKTVYWTSSSGAVLSAPVEGGRVTTVASKQDQPTAIVARAGSVYWTNQTGAGSVMGVKAAGDAPKPIVSGVNMPCGLAADAQAVYFTSYGSGTVSRVGPDGGKPVAVANGQAFPCNMALHGDALFWINTGRPSAVMKVGLQGGPAKPLVADISAPSGVATDGRHVYWTTTDKSGAVMRVSVDGGKAEVLAKGVGNPAAIAIARGVLVFADYSGGDVFKLNVGKVAAAPTAHDHAHHAEMAAAAPPASAPAAAPTASAGAPKPSAGAPPAPAVAPASPPAAGGPPDVELKLASKGNLMAFDQSSFTVKTGQRIKLVFQNVSTIKVMSHNWVLVKPGTEAKVAEAGLNAGESSSYVVFPSDDVIAATKLAGPGETVEVVFVAPAPGTYPFICTMPGHYMMMKGTFIVTS